METGLFGWHVDVYTVGKSREVSSWGGWGGCVGSGQRESLHVVKEW